MEEKGEGLGLQKGVGLQDLEKKGEGLGLQRGTVLFRELQNHGGHFHGNNINSNCLEVHCHHAIYTGYHP